jgi:anti-sigma factor RsiW
MTDDDAELVALIDNELDESRRTVLLARLAADERLRQRCEELRGTGAPLTVSFDALLRQAPLARLRDALPPADEPIRRPSRRFPGFAFQQLAAGLVIGLLVAGAAAWAASAFGLFGGRADWRTAVTEYTKLYTNETFSPLNPDVALQAVELGAVRSRVGGNLTPDAIALPGLRFATAFMLSHEGYPLGVIAYVDPTGAPVLLCILANRASDAPIRTERRGDLSLASWSDDGRSYLVIGHIPEERAVALAQILEPRV